jgi:hypothetical protein
MMDPHRLPSVISPSEMMTYPRRESSPLLDSRRALSPGLPYCPAHIWRLITTDTEFITSLVPTICFYLTHGRLKFEGVIKMSYALGMTEAPISISERRDDAPVWLPNFREWGCNLLDRVSRSSGHVSRCRQSLGWTMSNPIAIFICIDVGGRCQFIPPSPPSPNTVRHSIGQGGLVLLPPLAGERWGGGAPHDSIGAEQY